MTGKVVNDAQTSRMRILHAGKTLFARNGYEQTSTAAIARAAGSSESQLIRYYEGKAGLLEAIFNHSWRTLDERIEGRVAGAASGRDAVIRILQAIVETLVNDDDMAFLFLFEARRIRGGSSTVRLSAGFQKFAILFAAQIERGRADGSFRADLDPRIIGPAILGCAEGMMRERILADRNQEANPFADQAIVEAFSAMVNGLRGTAEHGTRSTEHGT